MKSMGRLLNTLRAAFLLAVTMMLYVSPVASEEAPAESLASGLVNPGYAEKPDWFANSFLDIREDVSEAAGAGKRVLLYFYQDGCPYCKKLLDINFALQETVAKTRKHYDVVAINMWGDREVTGFDGKETTEKDFARSLRVMFTPTLLFLDEQGKVVLRVNGYYAPHKFNAALDYGVKHTGRGPSFREYFATESPLAAGGVLHQEPDWLPAASNLSERNNKPLLVLFEQKD